MLGVPDRSRLGEPRLSPGPGLFQDIIESNNVTGKDGGTYSFYLSTHSNCSIDFVTYTMGFRVSRRRENTLRHPTGGKR